MRILPPVPNCSPKRLPGALLECSLQFVPACSHLTLPLSPSWLTPALEEVFPGARSSMPPPPCQFRWEGACQPASSHTSDWKETAGARPGHLFPLMSISAAVSSGPIFLLGNWDCFLWRHRRWHWANRLIWLCYRSWEAWWGMDQSSRHLPLPQVRKSAAFNPSIKEATNLCEFLRATWSVSKFQASQGYVERSYLKQTNKETNKSINRWKLIFFFFFQREKHHSWRKKIEAGIRHLPRRKKSQSYYIL